MTSIIKVTHLLKLWDWAFVPIAFILFGSLSVLFAFVSIVVSYQFLWCGVTGLCIIYALQHASKQKRRLCMLVAALVCFVPRYVSEISGLRLHTLEEMIYVACILAAMLASMEILYRHLPTTKCRVDVMRFGAVVISLAAVFPAQMIALREPIWSNSFSKIALPSGILLVDDDSPKCAMLYSLNTWDAAIYSFSEYSVSFIRNMPGIPLGYRDVLPDGPILITVSEYENTQGITIYRPFVRREEQQVLVPVDDSLLPKTFNNVLSADSRWAALNNGYFVQCDTAMQIQIDHPGLNDTVFLHWINEKTVALLSVTQNTIFFVEPDDGVVRSHKINSLTQYNELRVSPEMEKVALMDSAGSLHVETIFGEHIQKMRLRRGRMPSDCHSFLRWVGRNHLAYIGKSHMVILLDIETERTSFLSQPFSIAIGMTYHPGLRRILWTSDIGNKGTLLHSYLLKQ